jgi:hypothetical protein
MPTGGAGVGGPGAEHHEIPVMPGPGVVTDSVRRDLQRLPAWQPGVSDGAGPVGRRLPGAACQQMIAESLRHQPRLDDSVPPAQQRAGERPAERRIQFPGSAGVQELIAALRRVGQCRVGQCRSLFEQLQFTVIGGQGQRPLARKPAPGTAAASSSHRALARTASACSAPGALPLTQIRPKLRTLAPGESGSRSRCTTSCPRPLAAAARMIPSTPPPTVTTRSIRRRPSLVIAAHKLNRAG